MVHGSCSSRGCFAMTDETIAEMYALARESFAGGQRTFQFQSYPFRMTAKNLAQHRYDPSMSFWRNLKEGSDYFEVTREEPKVAVCGKRYVFGGADVAQGNCSPAVDEAVAQKRERDEQQVADLVASGIEPIKLVYDDGGQHQSFRQALADATAGDISLVVDARSRNRLGDVSRPEALAAGPQEIVLDANGKPRQEAPAAVLAYASGTSKALPATAKPKPAAAMTASAAGPRPGATESKPFYQRVFNGIGDLLGSMSAPVAETVQAAPIAASASPERRGSVPAPKPQADIRNSSTHVAAAN
jgi:hypothetical protein